MDFPLPKHREVMWVVEGREDLASRWKMFSAWPGRTRAMAEFNRLNADVPTHRGEIFRVVKVTTTREVVT